MEDVKKFKSLLNDNIFVSRPRNVINNNINEDIIIINAPYMNTVTFVRKNDKWKRMNSIFGKPKSIEEICKNINKKCNP